MPNNRYRSTQDAGEITRKRRENLKAHPMSPQEAARFLCEVHTKPIQSGRRFAIDWGPVNFVEVEGDLYWEAWRVLREVAGRGGK